MVRTSLDPLQTAAIAAALLMLAAFGAWTPVWPQSTIDSGERPNRNFAEIEAIAASGTRAPGSIDALMAMSEQYQSEGRHVLAAAAVERALEIARINYGLYSLEQIPLIRQSIDNELARDNAWAVWGREQQLIELVDRNPDDLRAVPILTELAAKRIDILERHLVGEYPPEIVIGCYYRRRSHAYSNCTGGSSRVASETLFFEALGYYNDAIGALISNERQSSPERLALEHAALHTVYAFAGQVFPPVKYELGKRRLQRLVDYHAEHTDLLSEIDAFVQLGDWELLYSNYSHARDVYSTAYQRLVDAGASRESIDTIFAPAVPVVIPASEPSWLDPKPAPQPAGFIDAAFEINRYGKSRQFEILDSTTSASKDARNRLEHMISTSRFRPQATDGHFDGAARVSIRYYVDE